MTVYIGAMAPEKSRSIRMIDALIVPRARDLGDGFQVRRALPAAERRMVGPFVFFDQMGPVSLPPGRGLDVRPHPHIGLATVTYLFEGEILHRDSLGTVQAIRPGEVNWMTAGRGIVHSERTPAALRAPGSRIFGIQTWVALAQAHEEAQPGFVHFGATDLPVIEDEGCRTRLIVGTLYGRSSPVPAYSHMFYAEVSLQPGARLALPREQVERAAYVLGGNVAVDGQSFPAGQLIVFRPDAQVVLGAPSGASVMLLGGEPLDGPRHIWWNFVSSRKERIAEAAADWKAGRFVPVPGEKEFIPLPERGPTPGDYP
jgi:redox-sensitive bicupin YhaK (pirin superfamily)